MCVCVWSSLRTLSIKAHGARPPDSVLLIDRHEIRPPLQPIKAQRWKHAANIQCSIVTCLHGTETPALLF